MIELTVSCRQAYSAEQFATLIIKSCKSEVEVVELLKELVVRLDEPDLTARIISEFDEIWKGQLDVGPEHRRQIQGDGARRNGETPINGQNKA
jgi:hypothetical protein